MKRLMWTGIELRGLTISGVAAQHGHEERRTRSNDNTRDAIELRGDRAQRHIEGLLARDHEIQEASDYLRQKGYRPLEAYVVYTERTGQGIPQDHMEGTVILWRWEGWGSSDPNLATGMMYAHQSESHATEINAVQLNARTGEEQWRWMIQRTGHGHKSQAFYSHGAELRRVQQECEPGMCGNPGLNWPSYYACASWGCGAAALVSFLTANPAAFFGGCTAAMIGCLQKLF